MNKITFMLLLSIVLGQASFAQKLYLEIGDNLPDVKMSDILYHTKSSASISDFKGKLLILNFWTYNCSPCISNMPKMDALQKKFGDKIMILPVIPLKYINEKGKLYLDSFWKNNPFTKKTALPVVMDTVLSRLVGLQGVPLEVWIKDSKIIAMTSSEYVNEKEIAEVVKGKIPNWESRIRKKYDFTKPLINPKYTYEFGSGQINYSFFTGYLPRHFEVGFSDFSNLKEGRVLMINHSIPQLYNSILKQFDLPNLAPNTLYLDKLDSAKLFPKLKKEKYSLEWSQNHSYCYELVAPKKSPKEQLLRNILQDFNRNLGLHGRFENRTVDALVITRLPGKTFKVSQSDNYDQNKFVFFDGINELIFWLNQTDSAPGNTLNIPVLNETNYTGDVKMYFPREGLKPANIAILKKHLNGYGFDVKKVKRTLSYYVLSESTPQLNTKK